MAKNEERGCQICVCLFELSEVKDRASEVVGFDATIEYSIVEMG